MSVVPVVRDRRVDGRIDLAPFTRFPIFFFNLEAVSSRIGSGFTRDPDRLRSVCERHLEELATAEVLLFTGSGFYLIVQSCSGSAALALANRINVALLKLFYGTDSMVPEQLRTLFQKVVPVRPAPVAAASEATDHLERLGAPSREPAIISSEKRAAFVQLAAQGRLPNQRAELRFLPVHDLWRHRVKTFFCSPVLRGASEVQGYGAFQDMTRHDSPFVDRAILAYAIKFARRLAASGTVAAIGTSVNFETLAWSSGRKIYCQALRAVGVADFPFLILKIDNVPSGILPSRLAEIVSAVRPLVKRVFIRLADCETLTQQCGRLGACGLVLSLPPGATPMPVMGAATWLVQACQAQNALSCMDRIDSEEALELVRLAGVRFGVGEAFGAPAFRGDAEPAAVEEFMEDVASAAPDDRKSASLRKNGTNGATIR